MQYPQLREALVLTLPGRLSRLKAMRIIELIASLREGKAWRFMVLSWWDRTASATLCLICKRGFRRAAGWYRAICQRRGRYDLRDLIWCYRCRPPESFGRTVPALSSGYAGSRL
ncbi:MAG: hypothetical protein IPK63_09770 [Candidatus Competibacteraceae bacterium]|nr:hypothetical protein [Candidatus Competibacteraceae bacterium]